MKKIIIVTGEKGSGKTTFIFSKLRASLQIDSNNQYLYVSNHKYFNTYNKNLSVYTYNEENKPNINKLIKSYNDKNFIIETSFDKKIFEVLNNIFTITQNYIIELYIVLDKLTKNSLVETINEINSLYKNFAKIQLILNKLNKNELNISFPLLNKELCYDFIKDFINIQPIFLDRSINYKELEFSEYLKPIALYKISLFDYFQFKNIKNDFLFEYFKEKFLKGCNG